VAPVVYTLLLSESWWCLWFLAAVVKRTSDSLSPPSRVKLVGRRMLVCGIAISNNAERLEGPAHKDDWDLGHCLLLSHT
jgi:hypothetical protein